MGQLLPYSFASLRGIGFVSAVVATDAPVTLTLPDGTKGGLLQATGGALHWTNDGEDPESDAGGGMVLAADAEPQWFTARDLATLKIVAAGADTHLLVSFYG